MSLLVGERLGVQEPRVELLPAGVVRTSGPDAAELAARCGLDLFDWQRRVLDAGLSERADGLWAASDVDVIASRQNGKNGGVEARELYGAVVLGEWIIHTAHLFKTTKESYQRLLSLVKADPDVNERLTYAVASPASGYEMQFAGGGRVIFIARSRTSGRGLTGDVLVFDEAQDLDDDAVGALLPTVSSRPNPQSWYLGSAPGPLSVVWHRRRTAGREGSAERRTYFEFSADPGADLDDRDAWAQANPSLGLLQTEEAIEAERQSLSDEMFARERLSISPDLLEGFNLIPPELWAACRDDNHKPSQSLAYALDVTPEATACAVAVSDGRHIEVVKHAPGTHWVVAECVAKRDRFDEIVLDPAGPAGALVAPLEANGITVRQVSTREAVQACGSFLTALTDGNLRHIGQRELDQATANADRREVGDGGWMWSRKRSSVDISPLYAVTLARWAAHFVKGPSVYEDRGVRTL